jgi:hypothetical protein
MAQGVTLADMTLDLRATLGYSMNIAHGVDQQQSLYAALKRTQIELWQIHDWPSLDVMINVPLSAGQQTVNVPVPAVGPPVVVGMDFEHINDLYYYSATDSTRHLLDYGIGPDEYSQSDSSQGVQGGNPVKWQFWGAGAGQPTDTIEIWPIPSAAYMLTFVGRRALLPLVATSDVCTLDSELIICQAAIPIMARNRDPTAQAQIQKAQSLMTRIKSRQGSMKRKPFLIVSRI